MKSLPVPFRTGIAVSSSVAVLLEKDWYNAPYTLPDGSVIRLTTAHYYTPTGRCVQKPYTEGVDKYYEDLTKRYEHGEYVNPDSIKFPDSLKYFTPNKRIVYGGGGIMPDIFIPLDTTRNTEYFTAVIRKGILNEYIQKYLETAREKIKATYPTSDDFCSKYVITPDFMKGFVDFADKEGVKKNDEEFAKSEKYLSNLLKARMAQNLYDFAAFWQVYNETDDVYKRALNVIQDKNKFKELKIND